MKRIITTILLLVMSIGCQNISDNTTVQTMKLVSPSFKDGDPIPAKHVCNHGSISPHLAWTALPKGTVSFAITCQDLDAPNGVFTHWIIYNISPVCSRLPENQPKKEFTDNSAVQGKNDFGNFGWDGPCPPAGKAHRYVFTVYSLDSRLDFGNNSANMKMFSEAIKDHVISKASLTGTYQTTKK